MSKWGNWIMLVLQFAHKLIIRLQLTTLLWPYLLRPFMWALGYHNTYFQLRRALGYHNILWHAFQLMHPKQKVQALEREFQESDESMPTSTFLKDSDSTEFYRKVLRVKAFKAFQFLRNEHSLFRSMLCTTVIGKFERVMYTFMKWQRDDFELTEFPPLVRMLHPDDSPITQALASINQLLTMGCIIATSSLTFQDVMRRPWAVLNQGHWGASVF